MASSQQSGGSFSREAFENIFKLGDINNEVSPIEIECTDFDENVLLTRSLELQINQVDIVPNDCAPLENLPFLPDQFTDPGIPTSDIISNMTSDVCVSPPLPGPQGGAASQPLPSNKIWPGMYGFGISLEPCGENAEKSISWTYSSLLHKLFVDRDKVCPINFMTNTPPPKGTTICIMPIFKRVENMSQIVKRCLNHLGIDGEPDSQHVVTCTDPRTQYKQDEGTGRYSLVVPFTEPLAGTDSLRYLFSFRCFMSCVGGLNRRPIQLVFSLEHEGTIIGRQVLETRVCACPGRDRKSEEKKVNPSNKRGTKRCAKQVTHSVALTALRSKKPKPDKEVFCLMIEGREKYETLLKLKEALDLMDAATPEQQASCRKRSKQIAHWLLVQQPRKPRKPRKSSRKNSRH